MPDASQFTAYARVLHLTPVEQPPLLREAIETPVRAPARRRKRQGLVSLVLVVLLPTFIAISYFWVFAADRYESEARFILRTPGRPLIGPTGSSLMQTIGTSRANEDGYVVREYLDSRDAMALLEKTVGLREMLAKAKWDPIWRFPPLFASDNDERLFSFYERIMSASFDSATGVSTLKIQAFTPDDANELATALLRAAEAQVNRLNERARHDAISLADSEVERMSKRAFASQAALTAFRERERLVDPSQATLAVVETIARLSMEAADLSVQLSELASGSPQTPQIAAVRNRRAAVEGQITLERQRLAGDAQSIAPRIAEYERLMLEREFAERALMAAMTAAEVARVDAQKQQVYLERVADPSRPDYPAYPLRIAWTLVVLAAGYMAYRVWRILSADTRRHSEL